MTNISKPELDPAHHVFRHIKKTWMQDDFLDPAAFRLRQEQDGTLEKGLSVNWVEYFQKPNPQDAVAPLKEILTNKGRSIGGTSKFALLNVGAAKATALYTPVAIVLDQEDNDPSHALIEGYQAYNDEVAEELAKVVISLHPANA